MIQLGVHVDVHTLLPLQLAVQRREAAESRCFRASVPAWKNGEKTTTLSTSLMQVFSNRCEAVTRGPAVVRVSNGIDETPTGRNVQRYFAVTHKREECMHRIPCGLLFPVAVVKGNADA